MCAELAAQRRANGDRETAGFSEADENLFSVLFFNTVGLGGTNAKQCEGDRT